MVTFYDVDEMDFMRNFKLGLNFDVSWYRLDRTVSVSIFMGAFLHYANMNVPTCS